MSKHKTSRIWHMALTILDVVLILVVSLLAEGAHFSPKQGRAIISGDSAQHVDGAEALLSPDKTPNFGFRKPGYTLILAGLGVLTGNMSWSAVVANHFMLAMVPLAAYGLGCNLRSRLAGWIAALLTVAQLQVALWGGRIMSEASYTCFMTFGVLLVAVALSRMRKPGSDDIETSIPKSRDDLPLPHGRGSVQSYPSHLLRRSRRVYLWLFGAGLVLGCAWLIRAIGVAVIAAAVVCMRWNLRRTPFRLVTAYACFLLPVAFAVVVECTLNYATSKHFQTSTGGLGIMLQTRDRYLQGSPFPDTETTRQFISLLPERSPEDAYRANKLDGCVARYRAIRNWRMHECGFNSLALKSGIETIEEDPKRFVVAGAGIFAHHLLRWRDGPRDVQLMRKRGKPIIVHEAAPDFQTSQDFWYAYWFLPHRSTEESTALVKRMRAASEQRAPFGRTGWWKTMRYIAATPDVVDFLSFVRQIGSIWPGFALIFCAMLNLNRRTCAFLALAYVLEAGIIAACGATNIANARYQFVWIGTDAALVACLAASVVEGLLAHLNGIWRGVWAWWASPPSSQAVLTGNR